MRALRRSSSPMVGPTNSSRTRSALPSCAVTASSMACSPARSSSRTRIGDVALPGLLDDGSREPDPGEVVPELVEVRAPVGLVLDESTAGEVETELDVADDQPARCDQHRTAGQGEQETRVGRRGRVLGRGPSRAAGRRRPSPRTWAARRGASVGSTSSISIRVTTRAVNIETMTPMARVMPKPRTPPEAKKNSTPAAMRVVTLASAMALKARSNPERAALRKGRPAACSSLNRSKTKTLPSTAMPMARTNPAMPGKVSVAPISWRTASARRA